MNSGTLEAMRADLLEYSAPFEDPAIRWVLVHHGFSRLLGTVELVPERLRGGDILQLGAEPYLLTLCLRRTCTGRLTLANYFGTADRRGEQRLTNQRTGEQLQLEYDLFNVETEDFPYPDASFDVVIFSEIIEHLAINPVRALAEIHRVLRPDGIVIVTTPNHLALMRLEGFLLGTREMVDRYSPGFGYGARHNREYFAEELRELLESTGFVVEEITVRDLNETPPGKRLRRAVWSRVLNWYSNHPRGEHIFLRARRASCFRWIFPPGLFDNMDFYVLVRHPWLEMGVNDSIQCAFGWYSLERTNSDRTLRWTRGTAQALLRSPERASAVCLDCYAPQVAAAEPLPVRLVVKRRRRSKDAPDVLYADEVYRIERGTWRSIRVPCRILAPGEEIEVDISPDPSALGAPALAMLPEKERGLAVQRVWFETEPSKDAAAPHRS
jgi:SAM-dependent methyltransferase